MTYNVHSVCNNDCLNFLINNICALRGSKSLFEGYWELVKISWEILGHVGHAHALMLIGLTGTLYCIDFTV